MGSVAAWPSQFTSRALCLSLQRDCLTKSNNTRAFSISQLGLSLRVLFITTITLAVNDDDGSIIESDHVM